jgi:hypothetical protein
MPALNHFQAVMSGVYRTTEGSTRPENAQQFIALSGNPPGSGVNDPIPEGRGLKIQVFEPC